MNEIEELQALAFVSDIAERYEDSSKYMEELIKKKKEDLTKEEKNIFYNNNKYIINSKRCALRTTNILKEKEERHSTQYIPIVTNYKSILESEIIDISKNIINIINTYLLKKELSDKSKVFYLKMKADYCRYICEIINTNENQIYIEESEKCYKEANDLGQNFPWTSPLRLGLSLNYSIFYYEIKKNVNQAIKIGKEAIKGAKKQLDKIKEEEDKDASTTLQTLKENVLLWEKE